MNDWRIGSLFSGIGGLEVGLERAGLGRTAWQVEQDPFACAVLEKHWPDAERFHDVRVVGSADLQPVETICGGFPCQDISNANQNANGLQGERSGLWFEFARVIGEMGPKIVVVENVAALLRRGIDRVLGDLAALGYDAEWGCISAASVGAHHRRDRIFIVAYANGLGLLDGRPSIFATETREQTLLEFGGSGPTVADSHGSGCQEQRRPESVQQEHGSFERRGQVLADAGGVGRSTWKPAIRRGEQDPARGGGREQRSRPGGWLPEPPVGRVVDGVPSRVDRLRGLGNAVVPQVAEYVGGLIVSALTERQTVGETEAKE